MPFSIETSEGRQYRVKHPDCAAISPKGGRITVSAGEVAAVPEPGSAALLIGGTLTLLGVRRRKA